jgi:hypothetical protein
LSLSFQAFNMGRQRGIIKMDETRLTPEARRALAEAAARRKKAQAVETPREVGGPKGPEPTRYGDWEIKGIASDF